jgi:hypothetical protein
MADNPVAGLHSWSWMTTFVIDFTPNRNRT